jgi:subtilisin family serine protease
MIVEDALWVMKNDVNILGQPVKIVVADTGCKTALLPVNLRPQMDFIPWVNASAYRNEPILHSHGSYCKLLISEYFRCAQKKADVEIHGYQCLDRNGSGSNEAIAAALAYAFDQKADFVNMSLGIHAENEAEMRAIIRSMGAVNRLGKACYEENGTLIFVAAGNEDELDDFIGDDVDAPAIFNWAIAVGALTDQGAKTDWSGDGAKLEFCMDGSDIFGILDMSGTSFSTPKSCGLAAYLKAYFYGGAPSARDLRIMLRQLAVHGGAHQHGAWCRDHGWGSLGPYAKLVLGHVAELRKAAGEPEGVSMFA